MRVSTKALFNLISKVNAKDAKEVLSKLVLDKANKEVDIKSPNFEAVKNTNTKELIESLLKDLSSNIKTKQNIMTTLKQNELPKQMQNTTKELTSLLNFIKTDKALAKFIPILEKQLVHVEDIKPENIKSELSKSGVFMESKLVFSTKNIMPEPLKEVLANLKEALMKEIPKGALHVKSIDNLLQAKKADKSFVDTLVSLVKDIKKSPEQMKQIEKPLEKLESIIKQTGLFLDKTNKGVNKNIPLKDTNVKEVLAHLKEVITKEIPKSTLHVKSIDKLFEASKVDKIFMQDIKNLMSDLKTSASKEKAVVQIVAKLENLAQQSSVVESKMQNAPQNIPKEVEKITVTIKHVMNELKDLVSKEPEKNAPTIAKKSQIIATMVDQILRTQDLFPQGLIRATISEQIQQVVNLIKSELLKTDAKSLLHVEVAKLTLKLENVIKEQIATKQIIPNQKLQEQVSFKTELLHDVKATLLSIKHELHSSTTPVHKEVFVQVDRLLTHIDYFQLVSLSSNASTTYLPFSWDSLEGGQISLKKLKENRFFCEINLKLKEYGKIDLMIMLFEDIHVNISVFAEKEEFTQLVQENLSDLKQGINKLGLIPSNIQLFDALKDKKLKEDTRNFASSTQLGSGLNIEV